MSEISREMARAKLRWMVWVYFVGVPALFGFLAWLTRDLPRPAELNPEDQAIRDANFELILPWLLGLLAIVGPFLFAMLFWMVKWSMKMPREQTPKSLYVFGACGALVCGALGAALAARDGANVAAAAAVMCAIPGLMFGMVCGTIVTAPRDAAVGATFGVIVGAILCTYVGVAHWNLGRPLWIREVWQGRVTMLLLFALVGAVIGIQILRVKRFKRQLAAEPIDRISK